MKTLLYGGTFNPPHNGHRAAITAAVNNLMFDNVLIVPTGNPPHKMIEENSPNPLHRLNMCKLMTQDLPYVSVMDWEIKEKSRFTIDTLNLAKDNYENVSLLLGTDMFLSLESWKNSYEILENFEIIFVSRLHERDEMIDKLIKHYQQAYNSQIIEIENNVIEISSTELRKLCKCKCNQAEKYLHPLVYEYIENNNLYR